jgi:hypothetical protein
MVGWAVGFFAFHSGWLIQLLLVIAVVAIVLRIIQGRKAV